MYAYTTNPLGGVDSTGLATYNFTGMGGNLHQMDGNNAEWGASWGSFSWASGNVPADFNDPEVAQNFQIAQEQASSSIPVPTLTDAPLNSRRGMSLGFLVTCSSCDDAEASYVMQAYGRGPTYAQVPDGFPWDSLNAAILKHPFITMVLVGILTEGVSAEEDEVTLYHASVDNYSDIMANGLDASRASTGATYVTGDIDAAIDTIENHSSITLGVVDGSNAGIVTSKIPASLYETYFDPFVRPYSGWAGGNLSSTEIPMRSLVQFDIFNQFIIH